MSRACENRRTPIYHPSNIAIKWIYQKGSLLMSMKNQVGCRALTGLLLVSLLCVIGPASVLALTAKDVTAKMTKEQQTAYLSGLVDMRVFDVAQSGDGKLAQCIHDAFYRDIGGPADAWARLYDAFAQFPDKDATTIVFVLVKKTCGG